MKSRMKLSYLVILLVVLATMLVGGSFSDASSVWYQGIAKPAWTPPGWVFGGVWTLIAVLTAISAFIVWSISPADEDIRRRRGRIARIFIANAFLNAFWNYIFFGLHFFGPSVWDAAALGFTVIVLIVCIWPLSRAAALLLVPYAVWVVFATDLAGRIWLLNR